MKKGTLISLCMFVFFLLLPSLLLANDNNERIDLLQNAKSLKCSFDSGVFSKWENGYNESFNGKLRDELLNGEIFYTLKEAIIMIERWRVHYNTKRPHTSLGHRPPAPETIQTPNTIMTYEN